MKKKSPHQFLFEKDCRGRKPEWKGEPNFRKYGRELDSKPTISLNIIGAAPVEPLMVKPAVATDGFWRRLPLVGKRKMI